MGLRGQSRGLGRGGDRFFLNVDLSGLQDALLFLSDTRVPLPPTLVSGVTGWWFYCQPFNMLREASPYH